MRFVLAIVLIGLIAALAAWFLPWWSISVVAFIIGLIMGLKPGKAFLAGFLGMAILWLSWILAKDIPNEHMLSSKMAVLFFKQPNYILFIVVNIFLGGLIGGLSAWAGALLHRAFVK